MAWYRYEAIDKTGALVQGEIQGSCALTIAETLMARGCRMVHHKRLWKPRISRGGGAAHGHARLMMCWMLRYLLQAKIPLMEALHIIQGDLGRGGFQKVLRTVMQGLEQGLSFHGALSRFPKIFTAFFCVMVQAGEATGQLPEAFARLSEHLAWHQNMQRRRRQLLLYPVALLTLVFAMTGGVLYYLVPELHQLAQVVAPEGGGYTTIDLLQDVSQFLHTYDWLLMTGIAGLGVIALTVYYGAPTVQQKTDQWLFSLPWVGRLVHKMWCAHFTETLWYLRQGGVRLLESLEIIVQQERNHYARVCLKDVCHQVRQGALLSEALSNAPFFPKAMVALIVSAEKSGAMVEALGCMRQFYKEDMQRHVETALKKLPMVLIGGVGMVLILLIVMVIYPLYENMMGGVW